MENIKLSDIVFIPVLAFMVYGLVSHRELISFAVKNLYRNLRRTFLTLIAIVLASAAIVFVETYIANSFWGLRESTIRSELGHIQIQLKDYLEKGRSNPTEYLIENHKDIIAKLESDPEISKYISSTTTELRFMGIIRGGENNSVNFLGRGVESEKDDDFSSLDILDSGSGLNAKNIYGITMGSGLAKVLGVKVKDYVTLLAATADGAMDILDADVQGIFSPLSREYSSVIVKADIKYAKQLVGTDGVNKILILLKKTEDTDVVADLIRKKLDENFSGENLKVYRWNDLAEFYNQVVSLYSNFFTIFMVIISLIVFFLIANTMTMSIFERFQEIGTLRSIGFTRSKVIYLLLNEGFILGVVGAILGIGLAMVLCYWINGLGILLDPPPGMSRKIPLSLVFRGDYWVFVHAFTLSVSVAWLSALSPAVKAARLKIVDCLRHV